MHVINTTSTIRFAIQPNGSPPAQSEYDVEVKKPDGTIEYTDNGLATYTAPTATTQGNGTFDQLFDMTGRWVFSMHIGLFGDNSIVSEVELYVVDLPAVALATSEITRHLNLDRILGNP